jgi:SAM-dependent methyltransferase
MSLFFRAAYRFGFKPWDTGISPPELTALVEGPDRLPPGKVLDLGCGTGTNAIYMQQHGWTTTGVDFVPRAINTAKRKATAAGVSPRFLVGDVTRLTELGLDKDFDLLFDLGCFHSIPDEGRDAYVKGATAVARPGATMLLFCFVRREAASSRVGPTSVVRGEVARRFAGGWEIKKEEAGEPFLGMDTAWYRLIRARVQP